jgi:hypothetical protein
VYHNMAATILFASLLASATNVKLGLPQGAGKYYHRMHGVSRCPQSRGVDPLHLSSDVGPGFLTGFRNVPTSCATLLTSASCRFSLKMASP